MTWHDPLAFLLLIPLLALLIYFYFFSKDNQGAFFYSSLNLLSKKDFSLRPRLAFLPAFLKWMALVFVITALARPQSTEQRASQTQKGIDIMVVMDISLSMLIEDMGKSTRLESAKQVVKNFVEQRKNDRIGLIVFSGESFTKAPLTFDHGLIKKNLAQVQTLPSIKQGTAIGVALANATARLQHSPKKSRVIIFLTDGENNTGFIDPETALELVKKNKIKVYTIGLGRRSGTFPVRYKVQNQTGRFFYQKTLVQSRINKELMRKISKQTGGQFFMANNLIALHGIFKKIDQLETYKIQINKWTKYEEHFKKFLTIGFVLYLLSVFFSITVFFRGI